MPATPTRPASSLPLAGWAVVALAAGLTTTLVAWLWPQWLHNPDLSHGLFAPVLFILLLNESRQRGPWRYLSENRRLRALRATALVVGVVLVALGGLYAAAIDWSHALVAFSLTLALSALLFATLLWLASDRVRALPFNWSSMVAVGLWPLCSPIPPGTYSRLTLQLQFWVTHLVLECLHLLGIAASTAGNIIQLAHTSVGVEEACSGVRSLLSCLVAAVFFSATLVRKPASRILLIALAGPLAFAMNIVRSLGLTLLANAGIDISGHWHDLTGFAVLGVTAVLLGGLAIFLETSQPSAAPTKVVATPDAPAPAVLSPPRAVRPWGLLAGLGLAAVGTGFFILNTHGPTRESGPIPDLEAVLPATAPGWDSVTTQDLYRFAATLQTDHLVQRTYVRNRLRHGVVDPVQVTVYLAYWPAGKVPVSQVASHTYQPLHLPYLNFLFAG